MRHNHASTVGFLFLFLASPSATAHPVDYEPGASPLGAATHLVLDRQPLEHRPALVDEAMANEAYLSALSLMAGEAARGVAASWWDGLQAQLDPTEAFYQRVELEIAQLGRAAATTAAILDNATQGGVDGAELGRAMVAGHLIVAAENFQQKSERVLIELRERATRSTPEARYAVVRPIQVGTAYLLAARFLLDQRPLQKAGATPLDLTLLAQQTGDAPIPGFDAREHGVIHRHARTAVAQARPDKAEIEPRRSLLEEDLGRLDHWTRRMKDAGLGADLPQAMRAEIAWWLPQVPPVLNGTWPVLVQELHGYAFEAIHASENAVNAYAPPTRLPTPTSVVALAALVALTLALRARRRPMTAVAFLLVLAVAVWPTASADPLPADPEQVPVAFTGAAGLAAVGNMAQTGDGRIHFVWNEETAGRLVLRHRSYDPAAKQWSDPVTVHEAPTNSTSPRIYPQGGELLLTWIEGYDPRQESQPAVLRACRLVSLRCTATTTLSDPDARVIAHESAVDPDGRARVVWYQLRAGHFSVLHRAQSPAGWATAVGFPTGSIRQLYPTISIDAAGTSHVAWYEQRSPSDARHRFAYAQVARGGIVASAVERVDHAKYSNVGSITVLAEAGLVHALYAAPVSEDDSNQAHGLFYRTRRAADGNWSTPQALFIDQDGAPNWPRLMRDGDRLVAYWAQSHPQLDFLLQVSEHVEGTWLRPLNLTGAPYRVILPFALKGDDGRTHFAWTGTGPGVRVNQMHYRIQPLSLARQAQPPRVVDVGPAEGGWLSNAEPRLAATLALDAPVDRARTRWTLDGATELAFRVEGNRLEAPLSWAAEGTHTTRLVVVDGAGGSTERVWTFGIDRVPPRFTAAITDASGADAQGWRNSTVTVTARAEGDTGSPVRFEVQVDERDWFPLPSSGYRPREGRLERVWIRAVDAAGNVALGERRSVGWDSSPPTLMLGQVPSWVGPQFSLYASLDSEGAPAQAQATLILADGGAGLQARIEGNAFRFEGVPPGAHTLWVDAWDEAGNRVGSGPFTLGSDATAPRLETTTDGAGSLIVRASDDESGVMRLEVGTSPPVERRGPAPLLELSLGSLSAPVRVRAFNAAGIGTESVLRPGEGLESPLVVLETPTPSTTPAADVGSVTVPQASTPAPGLTFLWIVLAAVALIRRGIAWS